MNKEQKELLSTKQKKIINNIVLSLSSSDPSLYYENSNGISHLIYNHIHEDKINVNDFELVKDLSASDILILLSYKSNCC